MIKMQVIGHLGRDCTINVVNGKSVMNITVAHSEKYKDAQGTQREKTLWVDCAYWSDRTAIAPYLKKGTQVYVEGIPDMRTYTKNDGSFGASMTLRILSIQLLGSKDHDQSQSQPSNNYQDPGPANPAATTLDGREPIDDLPF